MYVLAMYQSRFKFICLLHMNREYNTYIMVCQEWHLSVTTKELNQCKGFGVHFIEFTAKPVLFCGADQSS